MGIAARTIYQMMKEKGIRQKDLAASVGEDPRQMNQQLRKAKDIRLERFCRYADAAGYDVAVIDRISGDAEKLDCSKKISKK